MFVSYIDLHLEDNCDGRMRPKFYERWFQFSYCEYFIYMKQHSINPRIYSILKMMRYSSDCVFYQDFLDRELLPTIKLQKQMFLVVKLASIFRSFYGRQDDLDNRLSHKWIHHVFSVVYIAQYLLFYVEFCVSLLVFWHSSCFS